MNVLKPTLQNNVKLEDEEDDIFDEILEKRLKHEQKIVQKNDMSEETVEGQTKKDHAVEVLYFGDGNDVELRVYDIDTTLNVSLKRNKNLHINRDVTQILGDEIDDVFIEEQGKTKKEYVEQPEVYSAVNNMTVNKQGNGLYDIDNVDHTFLINAIKQEGDVFVGRYCEVNDNAGKDSFYEPVMINTIKNNPPDLPKEVKSESTSVPDVPRLNIGYKCLNCSFTTKQEAFLKQHTLLHKTDDLSDTRNVLIKNNTSSDCQIKIANKRMETFKKLRHFKVSQDRRKKQVTPSRRNKNEKVDIGILRRSNRRNGNKIQLVSNADMNKYPQNPLKRRKHLFVTPNVVKKRKLKKYRYPERLLLKNMKEHLSRKEVVNKMIKKKIIQGAKNKLKRKNRESVSVANNIQTNTISVSKPELSNKSISDINIAAKTKHKLSAKLEIRDEHIKCPVQCENIQLPLKPINVSNTKALDSSIEHGRIRKQGDRKVKRKSIQSKQLHDLLSFKNMSKQREDHLSESGKKEVAYKSVVVPNAHFEEFYKDKVKMKDQLYGEKTNVENKNGNSVDASITTKENKDILTEIKSEYKSTEINKVISITNSNQAGDVNPKNLAEACIDTLRNCSSLSRKDLILSRRNTEPMVCPTEGKRERRQLILNHVCKCIGCTYESKTNVLNKKSISSSVICAQNSVKADVSKGLKNKKRKRKKEQLKNGKVEENLQRADKNDHQSVNGVDTKTRNDEVIATLNAETAVNQGNIVCAREEDIELPVHEIRNDEGNRGTLFNKLPHSVYDRKQSTVGSKENIASCNMKQEITESESNEVNAETVASCSQCGKNTGEVKQSTGNLIRNGYFCKLCLLKIKCRSLLEKRLLKYTVEISTGPSPVVSITRQPDALLENDNKESTVYMGFIHSSGQTLTNELVKEGDIDIVKKTGNDGSQPGYEILQSKNTKFLLNLKDGSMYKITANDTKIDSDKNVSKLDTNEISQWLNEGLKKNLFDKLNETNIKSETDDANKDTHTVTSETLNRTAVDIGNICTKEFDETINKNCNEQTHTVNKEASLGEENVLTMAINDQVKTTPASGTKKAKQSNKRAATTKKRKASFNKNGIRNKKKKQGNDEQLLYSCDECSYQSYNKQYFGRHKLIHSKAVLKCEICNYFTNIPRNLITHVQVHLRPEEVTMWKCPHCDFQAKRKGNLTHHLMLHKKPDDLPLLQCEECLYQTNSKRNLKAHKLTHKFKDQLALFSCDSCSFKAKTKNILQKHLKVHESVENIKMHKCETCSFATKYKSSLLIHRLVHKHLDEIRTYDCSECLYRSKHKHHLKKHLLLHKSSHV